MTNLHSCDVDEYRIQATYQSKKYTTILWQVEKGKINNSKHSNADFFRIRNTEIMNIQPDIRPLLVIRNYLFFF